MRASMFILTVALALTAACGGNSDRTPLASPTPAPPTPAPSVAAGLTGVPILDRAIAAITANDAAALGALVTYGRTPCASTPAGGPPICRGDESGGTLVEAVLAAQCEGFYVRRGELRLDDLRIGTSQFYGAWRKDGVFGLPSRYILIFERSADVPPRGAAWALVFDDRGIIAVDYGCAQSPAEMAQARGLTDRIER